MADEGRLSRIDTDWILVRKAHEMPRGIGAPALRELLERYREPIHRYLLGAVRNEDTAADLLQDFAVRFLRGDFWRADQARGRFRDFVKRAVINLVANHRKTQQVQARRAGDISPEEIADTDSADLDQELLFHWREQLLQAAWEALSRYQLARHSPYSAILYAHCCRPELTSSELAVELNAELRPAIPFTDAGIRKILERARRKFAFFVMDAIARAVPATSAADIADELAEVGLLNFCKGHLEDWLAAGGRYALPFQGPASS